MGEIPHLNESLERLRTVFRETAGLELTDTDVAELAGLDYEECQLLLGVLAATGAIERPRHRVFVGPPANWWTSAPVDS